MDEQTYWQAVLDRNTDYDDLFVYAVKSTKIYCRPTCPSRRPMRDNVQFFSDCQSAEGAGYRPCKRCHPHHDALAPQWVTDLCRHLEEAETIPTLDTMSNMVNLSPYHLQRMFKRVVGVSPRQYADAHRQNRLKALLKETPTVTEAVYGAGYNGSSMVYEHTNAMLGMSPIHYRDGGVAMSIRYAITQCDLGYLLVAITPKGICKISLGESEAELEADLATEFPHTIPQRDDDDLGEWINSVLAFIGGEKTRIDLPLDIRATSFQRTVWEALRKIPYGATWSYDELADHIGKPTASRAVARACATNPVALAIPCHRVVRKNGDLAGYRWGIGRKRAILQTEHDYFVTGSE